MKRRSLYLYSGDNDYYSACFGYGPADSPVDHDRWYSPTRKSAWRLKRAMERILNSKQFWCMSLGFHSLTILLRRPKEL